MTTEQVVSREGLVEPHAAEALAAVLDVPSRFAPGDALPEMWHCVYLLDTWPQRELGADGHPLGGVPTPPAAGQRRMFAGGRSHHLVPLRVGAPALRTSQIVSSVEKRGRSGPLTFVTVRHEITQAGNTAIVDEHDIVYRPQAPEAAAGDARPAAVSAELSQAESLDRWDVDVDPVLLFRFSALTFNAHRIHYDQAYAAYEGYPGLVVHGPLQALLMAETLRRSGERLTGRWFDYRFLAPAIAPVRLSVLRRGPDAPDRDDVLGAVEIRTGDQTMVARGRLQAPAGDSSLQST